MCKRCSREGAHYTRKNGTKVSPCVACSTEKAAARAAAKVFDDAHREKRRKAYQRYNGSDKGKARLARHRNRPPEATPDEAEEPGPASRASMMMEGFA